MTDYPKLGDKGEIIESLPICDFTKTYVPSDRDYVEDFKDDDNGRYFYTCKECKMNYLAHKRRRPIICKKCNKEKTP